MKQQACSYESKLSKSVKFNYLLSIPEQLHADQTSKWPLLLFLHGAGERGSDLELLKRHGIPKLLEKADDFPCITVSPQCPLDSYWPLDAEALNGLLEEIIKNYPVDEERIYLTGLSMGGYGTWQLALTYPHRFAAIAPICGGGIHHIASFIKHIPVWTFHGAKDEVVPISKTEEMVEALRSCGGDVQFTVYPEAGHDSWTQAYEQSGLIDWLLKQRRG